MAIEFSDANDEYIEAAARDDESEECEVVRLALDLKDTKGNEYSDLGVPIFRPAPMTLA